MYEPYDFGIESTGERI